MATTKNPGVLWNVSQSLETEDKTRARNNIGAVSADDVSTAISGKVDDTDYATSSAYGIVKLGSDTVQSTAAETVTSTTGRTYAVQKNANGQLLVNVPWTDSQSVGDGTLTINQGNTQLGTFSANQSTPSTINVQSYLVSAGNGISIGEGTSGNTTTYTVGVKQGTGLAINSQDNSLYVKDPVNAADRDFLNSAERNVLSDYNGGTGIYGWKILETTPQDANHSVIFNAIVIINRRSEENSSRALNDTVAAYLSIIDRGQSSTPPKKSCVFNSITSYNSAWNLYGVVSGPVDGKYTTSWYIGKESGSVQYTSIKVFILNYDGGQTASAIVLSPTDMSSCRTSSAFSSGDLVMKCSRTPFILGSSGVGSSNTPIYLDSDGTFSECQISGGESDTAKRLYNQVTSSSGYNTLDGDATAGHNWIRLTLSRTSDLSTAERQSTLTTHELTYTAKGNGSTASTVMSAFGITVEPHMGAQVSTPDNKIILYGSNEATKDTDAFCCIDTYNITGAKHNPQVTVQASVNATTVIRAANITVTRNQNTSATFTENGASKWNGYQLNVGSISQVAKTINFI
jgi:hypothetical protein